MTNRQGSDPPRASSSKKARVRQDDEVGGVVGSATLLTASPRVRETEGVVGSATLLTAPSGATTSTSGASSSVYRKMLRMLLRVLHVIIQLLVCHWI